MAQSYKDARVKNLRIIGSYHGPILSLMNSCNATNKHHPFRFEGKCLFFESNMILVHRTLKKFIKGLDATCQKN